MIKERVEYYRQIMSTLPKMVLPPNHESNPLMLLNLFTAMDGREPQTL